ncbi:MAG: acyl-ACP--UDP-N-acetylglucosamine O-acyltransferase [Planctomycetota bacterium]|nr:acyl-ACP--UDP-N-acetylglucosamine O-acyltransferase [Planctomycetota bacterium]
MSIHPSALVDPDACVGQHVSIGPFCVVEKNTVIGDGCQLDGRVTIKQDTVLGVNNHVCEGAVLGGQPQHIHAGAELGRLVIGSGNSIRENVTIHRGLRAEDVTRIGDHNMLMVNAHIAHDCQIGDHVVIINNAMIAGHATIEDRAYLAGGAGVQQFRRVGKVAAVGGYGRIVKDLPPFVTLDGNANGIVGLNLVGLRRAGYSRDDIRQLKDAYRVIYRSGLSWQEVLQRLPQEFPEGPAAEFYPFFSTGEHGFMPERRAPGPATVKLFQPAESPLLREAG